MCVNQITFCMNFDEQSINRTVGELIYFRSPSANMRVWITKRKMMISIQNKTKIIFCQITSSFVKLLIWMVLLPVLYKIYLTTNLPIISKWWIPIHNKIYFVRKFFYIRNHNDKWAVNGTNNTHGIRTIYLRWPHFRRLVHLLSHGQQ